MPAPVFEFFETLCSDLKDVDEFVLTDRVLSEALVPQLQHYFQRPAFEDYVAAAIGWLQRHFAVKTSVFPFAFHPDTGIVRCQDRNYIDFICAARDARGDRARAKGFEDAIGTRLVRRLRAGNVYNVGWPRERRRKRAEFIEYLGTLGFEDDALRPRDKDGGLDLLWLPALGSIPIRPIVLFQCKNGLVNPGSIREANNSAVFASRVIHHHSHMRSHGVYMSFVIFNDYLDREIEDLVAGLQYAPLGLSDLGNLAADADLVKL